MTSLVPSSVHLPFEKAPAQTGHTLSVMRSGPTARTWLFVEHCAQRPLDGIPQPGQILLRTTQLTNSQYYHLCVWDSFNADDAFIVDDAAVNPTANGTLAH